MKTAHFDTLVRVLGSGATRRGVLAGVAGVLGLRIAETEAERRKRAERRTTKRREGSGDRTAQKGNSAATTQAVTISEGCPKKPAQSIAILSAYYPGYWWDHTNLTVAVQAHPNADPALIAAVREAIVIWNDVLARAGALSIVTLTDVTDTQDPEHKADIVLHYVSDAGGTVFGGYAICGEHKCNNVLVRSDLPKPLDRDPYTAEYLGWVTLHELGHALGLGHAEPLEETNDLMGYGWPPLDPVLSPCDLRALEVVFAWAIAGDDPYPPTVASVDCSDLCKRRR
jgi:hypothetical protein